MCCLSSTVNNDENSARDLEMALALGERVDEKGLLTIILSRHLNEGRAMALAARLLKQFSKLATILDTSFDELTRVKGITRKIAIELKHIRTLLCAVSLSTITNTTVINSNAALSKFCRALLCNKQHEEFHGLFLNKRFELIHHAALQIGTVDHVTVYPRELLKTAISHSACHIILIHNHPFGKARPSQADIAMTDMLSKLSNALGISIADHLIVAGNASFSFRKNGLISPDPFCPNQKETEPSPIRLIGKMSGNIEMTH